MSKIIKQDINFLEKPLWFPNPRHDGMGFIWKDKDGYEYRTGYKSPDKIDILILLYLLFEAQKKSYTQYVETTKRKILKECGLPVTNRNYYARVEDSLMRWKNIAIKFEGCFYDDGKKITVGFGIIDDYEIDKRNRKVQLSFNEKWLAKIEESNFFKLINFNYYKALKRPISRRLYEILCKSFVGRDQWPIKLVNLGGKLTLSGRNGVVYASDVLVKIKPAVNEINKLAKNPALAKGMGLKLDDLFLVEYELKGKEQERVIIFQKKRIPKNQPVDRKLIELLELVKEKSKSKKLADIIAKAYERHDYEYVYSNIRYANTHMRKNYSVFLQKALIENWAMDWWEEELRKEKARQKTEKLLEAAKQRAMKESDETNAEEIDSTQNAEFLEAIGQIPEQDKAKLWDMAQFLSLGKRPFQTKLSFVSLSIDYFKREGKEFSIDEMGVARKL